MMHRLENEQLALSVLPERGAKITQLYFKPAGVELLWQPTGTDDAAEPTPGVAFDSRHAWGWDEMFPAIEPHTFEANGRRLAIPDHGEVWTLPWEVSYFNGVDTLTVTVAVQSTGYQLTRKTTVAGATVRHEYTLTNKESGDLPWIWAAHPLFSLKNGATLHVPPEWTVVRNAHESRAMPGYNSLYPYPGSVPRLNELPAPDSGLAYKYYFEYPNYSPEHAVVLSQPSLGLDIRVQSDPRVAPWFGVWCNAGGLFGHNNVAVEPASAPMDSLSAANRLGRLPRLPGYGSISWWMAVSVTSQ